MKQLFTFLAAVIICSAATAQTDSTKKAKSDTIRIGSIVIVKNGKKNNDVNITMGRKNKSYYSSESKKKKNSNVSTNWWIVDLGFANYNDNTNYANAGSYLVNRPGSPVINKEDFKLRAGKSVNVNLWFFMQRLNVIKHYVNLKIWLWFGVE
ncbi:MAG: hypothetical protein WDM90_16865 [Ferruginibacter sp.]